MLLWRTGVAKSNSSTFCPFPFKFLNVNKTFAIHLSNGLKSSGGGWVISSQVTKVTLEINWLSDQAAFWRFLVLFFDFSVWECYLKDLQRSCKQSSIALSYIFSLANCDFHMKLMVPGNEIWRRPCWGRMKDWGRLVWFWSSITLKYVVLRTKEGPCWQKAVVRIVDN